MPNSTTPMLDAQQMLERDRDAQLAERGLPEVAYRENHDKTPGQAPVIAVRRGQSGYYPLFTPLTASVLNFKAGVTPAQCEAMFNGSLFGWTVPGADPTHPLVLRAVAGQSFDPLHSL